MGKYMRNQSEKDKWEANPTPLAIANPYWDKSAKPIKPKQGGISLCKKMEKATAKESRGKK